MPLWVAPAQVLAKRAVRYTTTRLATNMSYTYKYAGPRYRWRVQRCLPISSFIRALSSRPYSVQQARAGIQDPV